MNDQRPALPPGEKDPRPQLRQYLIGFRRARSAHGPAVWVPAEGAWISISNAHLAYDAGEIEMFQARTERWFFLYAARRRVQAVRAPWFCVTQPGESGG